MSVCRRRKLANKKAQQTSADSPRNGRGGGGAMADADGEESPSARRPARRQRTAEPNGAAAVADLVAADQHMRMAALGGVQQPSGVAALSAGLPQSQADFLRSLAPAYAHDLGATSKPPFGLVAPQVRADSWPPGLQWGLLAPVC